MALSHSTEPVDTPAGTRRPDARAVRKAVAATAIGNAVEWFDYGVYGFQAATVGAVFFPSGNTAVSLLSSLAAFGLSFVIRPLGGLIFGPLADRIGRRRVLAAVIILMSASTFVVGLLPGYRSIGVAAPILLVLARLIQGISAGGEVGGATALLAEFAPPGRRAFVCSFNETTSFVAFLLGSGTVLLSTSLLSDASEGSWGWRIPFLIAAPLGTIGLYLRTKMEESPDYQSIQAAGEAAEAPLRESFATAWRPMITCGGLAAVKAVGHWMILTYLSSYLSETVRLSKLSAALATTIAIFVVAALIPVAGLLADRFGRRPMLLIPCCAVIVLAYPAFWLMSHGTLGYAIIGILLLGIPVATLDGAVSATMSEIFPTRLRSVGLSVPYNISVAAFGGGAPFIAAYLVFVTGNDLIPAIVLIVPAVLSLIAAAMLRETRGTRLATGVAALPATGE
jgi:MHS family proline/betaine transporter-like MFS transporter